MNTIPAAAELYYAVGWREGRTDRHEKLVFSFHNSENTQNLLKPYLLICYIGLQLCPQMPWLVKLSPTYFKTKFGNYSKIGFQTSLHFHQLQLFVSKYVKSYMLSNMKNSSEKYLAKVEI